MAEKQKSSILPDLIQNVVPALIAASSTNPNAAFNIASAALGPFVETRAELKQSKLDDLRIRGLQVGVESAEFEFDQRKSSVQRSNVDRGRKMARDSAHNTYINQTTAAMQKLGIVPDDAYWEALMKRPGANQALGIHEGIQLYLGSLSDSRLEPALNQLLQEQNIKKITGIDELILAVDSRFPGDPRNEQILSMARDLPEDEQDSAVFFMDLDQGSVVPVNVDSGQRLMAEGFGLFAKEAKLEWKRQENKRTIKGETINFGTDLFTSRGMDISTAQHVSENVIGGFLPWQQNKFALWNGMKNFEKKTDPVAINSFLNQMSQAATSQQLAFVIGDSMSSSQMQVGKDDNGDPIMKFITNDLIESELSGDPIFNALNSRANAYTEGAKARSKPAKTETRTVGGDLWQKVAGGEWEKVIDIPEKAVEDKDIPLTASELTPHLERATKQLLGFNDLAEDKKPDFNWREKLKESGAAMQKLIREAASGAALKSRDDRDPPGIGGKIPTAAGGAPVDASRQKQLGHFQGIE